MDARHPTTHIVIEGENLRREREFLGGPRPLHPNTYTEGLAVLVILIAIGAALYAWNLAQGAPV